MPKILVAEDSEVQRKILTSLLRKQMGYECVEAADGAEAVAHLQADAQGEIAAVLLDLSMPNMDGRAALPKLLAIRPHLPVIVVTGAQSVAEVVEMIKLGATNFLPKPPEPELLRQALGKAMRLHEMRLEIEALRQEGAHQDTKFSSLIGHDPVWLSCVKLGQRAASSDITVMITGESGVGKEVLARAIHDESARAAKPFVAVNCGALPKDLVESILFGHKKGSFTGAVADTLGKFREAHGGTLFLDEVAELPLEAQVKLLRVLQEREVEPVGGDKPVPVNIRIIAATNRKLTQAVQNGHLREDLFYRLNVFPIHLAALRERGKDILPLSMHFLRRYGALEGKLINGFDGAAQNWLTTHSWPGNIRELENRVFRAVLLCDQEQIGIEHLLPVTGRDLTLGASEVPQESYKIDLLNANGEFKTLEVLKEEIIQAALGYSQNNVVLAAKYLGVGKSTLYRQVPTHHVRGGSGAGA